MENNFFKKLMVLRGFWISGLKMKKYERVLRFFFLLFLRVSYKSGEKI